jgi:hypothetical protein
MHEIAVSRSLAVTVIVVRAYGHEPPSTSGSLVVTQNNAFWWLEALLARRG